MYNNKLSSMMWENLASINCDLKSTKVITNCHQVNVSAIDSERCQYQAMYLMIFE